MLTSKSYFYSDIYKCECDEQRDGFKCKYLAILACSVLLLARVTCFRLGLLAAFQENFYRKVWRSRKRTTAYLPTILPSESKDDNESYNAEEWKSCGKEEMVGPTMIRKPWKVGWRKRRRECSQPCNNGNLRKYRGIGENVSDHRIHAIYRVSWTYASPNSQQNHSPGHSNQKAQIVNQTCYSPVNIFLPPQRGQILRWHMHTREGQKEVRG